MTVTQEMVQTYGETVGDLWWIHVDVPRAKKALCGTIVYGLLTLSLVPTTFNEIMSITDHGNDLNYGCDNVRFLSVVHGGNRIRASSEPARMRTPRRRTLRSPGVRHGRERDRRGCGAPYRAGADRADRRDSKVSIELGRPAP